MKIIMTIITKSETFDVHVDIEDEATAQAKLAQMLQDIQKRFCARSETKKPATSAAPKPARESAALTPAEKS
jgi:hypothetical protein